MVKAKNSSPVDWSFSVGAARFAPVPAGGTRDIMDANRECFLPVSQHLYAKNGKNGSR
jgi:hypothetical protein